MWPDLASPADLRALKENLDRETSFMLLEPAERSTDEQDVAADLATVAGTVNSVVLSPRALASTPIIPER